MKKELYTILVDNVSLTKEQFFALCHSEDGLGTYQFANCNLEGTQWQSYTKSAFEFFPEQRMEWVREDCDKWLDKNQFPRNAINVRILITEGN